MAFNSAPKQFGTILLGVAGLGAFVLNLPAAAGRVTLFIGQILQALAPPWYGRNFARQLVEIGFYSLPVVGMTAIFTGMVLALQSYTGFARFFCRKRDSKCCCGLHHPRAWSSAGRADCRRTSRLGNGG